MKRKSLLFGCVTVTAVAGSMLVINRFITSLPDRAVRTAGIILLVALVALGFFIERGNSKKKTECPIYRSAIIIIIGGNGKIIQSLISKKR